MFTKTELALVAVTAMYVRDTIAVLRNDKRRKKTEDRLYQIIEFQTAQVNYLCDVLEANSIQVLHTDKDHMTRILRDHQSPN